VAGATLSAPVEGAAGMPGSMLTDEAFSTSQARIAAPPLPIEPGLTSNLMTLGALLELPPPISTVMQPAVASNSTRANNTAFFISIPHDKISSHKSSYSAPREV
jgi:hypothetical protein